ncbi:MAG: hypothetical protein DSY90_01690 [Deltaproteobacteria bacterium]|nr:MAG: hypothetical protein DSY90_01690 [Deltaproteobacteria bacterium]
MISSVINSGHGPEQRMAKRKLIDKFYSVQFSLDKKVPIYQFKLKDISDFGLCIIINQGSPILTKIRKNEKLDMTFCAADAPSETIQLKTKIAHITPNKHGKYKNHVLMGLSIVDEEKKNRRNTRAAQ